MIKKLKSKYSKLPYAVGVVVVLILGSLYAYHLTNKAKPSPTINQYTKGQTTKSNSSPASSNQTVNSSTGSKTASTTAATLIAPTGNFVSDHHPNLSGSPAPNSMTSVCNTTPGASCQIFFIMGSTQKSLAVQTTDSGGSTYWYWTLQSAGLSAGTWQVKAVAKLGSQSQSATDPTDLDVKQ